MKALILFSLLITQTAAVAAQSSHQHEVPHNLILLGKNEVFASHIVYKEPHNYQVLLGITLDPLTQQSYVAAKEAHAESQFLLVLDPVNIRDISSQSKITGRIVYLDKEEAKHEVVPYVEIPREQFQVLYFDELPLSLNAVGPHVFGLHLFNLANTVSHADRDSEVESRCRTNPKTGMQRCCSYRNGTLIRCGTN